MQATPEFRLGSGSIITKIPERDDKKEIDQELENNDEAQLPKQKDEKDTPRLLILGGTFWS